MKPRTWFCRRLLFGAVCLAATLASAQPAAQIPLRDFFKNPEKSYYLISPNGQYLSFLQPYQNRLNIFDQVVGAKEALRVTAVTDRDIAQYFWKGNERLCYLKDFGGDENFHLFAVDKAGQNERDLTPFDGVKVELIDRLEDHDTDVLIGLNKRNREVFDVYRLNAATGVLTLAAENPGNVTGWLTDHAGRLRVATTTDGVNTGLLYRPSEKDSFRALLSTTFKETFTPLFFTFDNQNLYAASDLGRDKVAVVKYDLARGRELEVLFEHPEVDAEGMEYSRKRKALTFISYVTWRPERKFLDKETGDMYKKLEEKLPNYDVNVVSRDRDEEVFLVQTKNDRTSDAYYLYEKKSDKLTKLADLNPRLKEQDLAEMKPITYRSRDGLVIHGYLTLPKGKEPKNLPVVVHPHGGPWERVFWGFDPEVQFLANRGYSVFQMNFRGSKGYGRKFWEISFKQWGKTMQDDVSDGVRWLIEEGIADPKRVAIFGTSYGGYSTLAGLAFSPELYACGVDYVGISNLFTILETIPPYWKPYLEMLYEMLGNPKKDSALMAAASPVFHADNIRVPLLVAQGARDPRVNINESNQIVAALRARGIAVTYLVKENEGHGFENEENRFDFYEA
ncbi:MAG: S9 family peptidase, partial [candidate division Zixibacteria bacterium]|nr:S9 family peptidase [candidate division Zixibacteria bacterium]